MSTLAILQDGRGGGAARREDARGADCRSPAAADDSEVGGAQGRLPARPPPMTAKGALAQAQRRRGCALLASALASALDLQSTVSPWDTNCIQHLPGCL